MSRTHAWSQLLLGLGVLAGAILVFRPVPTADVGTVPDLSPSPVETTPRPRPSPTSAPPTIGTRSAGIADLQTRQRGPAPERVRVPGLDIDLPVIDVGTDGDLVAVPEDIRTAGWYRFGPSPGEAGSAVITAHVDSRTQGPGPFAALRAAEPGTYVEILLEDGSTRTFEVVARRRFQKTALPTEQLFARDGPPRLALITCGGPFDPATRSYRDNVVVYAELRP